MQEIIVLGEIPGTSTQLDFTDWALLSIAILLAMFLAFSFRDIQKSFDRHLENARAKKAIELISHYHLLS